MSFSSQSMTQGHPYLDLIAHQTSTEVFHANEWGVSWGREIIEELKEIAQSNVRSRARLCLHPNHDDQHQEMLIVMARSTIEVPHRRTIGFDSKVVIEGQAKLRYYSADGDLLRSVSLGDDSSRYVHTVGTEYHSLLAESDWFVFLEILQGPFDTHTTEWASWGDEIRGNNDSV